MNTPCQESPELWVSDNVNDRAQAARACKSECPTESFRACAVLAFNTNPELGIYAGVDYNHSNRIAETKFCEGCKVEFERRKAESNGSWGKRRFCSRKCSASVRSKAQFGPKTCQMCGAPYEKHPHTSRAQWEISRFCSMSCAGKSRATRWVA